MSSKARSYVKLFLMFAGLFIAYIVAGGLLQGLCGGEIAGAALQLANAAVFSTLTLLVYRKLFGESPRYWRGFRGAVVTAVLSGGLIAFFDLFYKLGMIRQFAENWLFCLLLAAAAGLAEEVLFRAFLLDYISKKASLFVGLAVTSLIFGSLHALNFLGGQQVSLLYVFNCIAAGVFLSVLYYEYGLACSLFYHISWNAVFSENAVESKPLTGVVLLALASAVFLVEERMRGSPAEQPR